MRALYLPVIGSGNWDLMGRKQRAQELVMVPLEALTGAMKSGVVPVPQPRLPEAIVGIEVGRGTGIETEIVTGIVTEIVTVIVTVTVTGSETGSVTGTGTEIGNGIVIVTGIETEIETEIGTEKALSADQTPSLNAGPLGRGILSTCMEKI